MNEEKMPMKLDLFIQEEYGNVEVHEPMYHYTSAEGLMGIVGKEHMKFRFTKYSVLNDVKEGKIFEERYKAICDDLLKEGIIDNKIKKMLLEIIKTDQGYSHILVDSDGSIAKEGNYNFEDMFICSFSRKQDSLPMWNYYVKNGGYQGYNIKIRCPKQEGIRVFHVEYSDEHLKNILIRCAKTFNEKRKTEDEYKYKSLVSVLRHYLNYCRFIHKSDYFKHEEEVRLILMAEESEKKKCKFREKNGILMPYIEKNFDKEILEKITVGPLIEREVAKENLELYLENNRYKNVEIDYSKAPIRY